MPALLLLNGPQAGRRHQVRGEVLIGRSPACTIALEDAKVSRRHARLEVDEGQAQVFDLGSRNGTWVNGERLQAEAVILPGDRLQVGDSTVLFERTARASLMELEVSAGLRGAPLEELVEAAPDRLYLASLALLSATSEAAVLRCAAEALAHAVSATTASALLGSAEGLLTMAVTGEEAVQVPRAMVRGALERKEVARAGGRLCAPLVASGGAPFGVLYAERAEGFPDSALPLIAALGRLAGEAITSARARADQGARGTNLIGSARPLRKALDLARRAAQADGPVVVVGEPGSGRAQLALWIHDRSARAQGPLARVDCRRPPAEVQAALFGHGSGPGVPPRSSQLREADGGALLLLAVEALPRPLAERLARLLRRRVAPAREGGEAAVDVRVLATAGQRLEELVERGGLAPELARALQGQEVEVPPMRDRRPDVPALMEYFAAEAAGRRLEAPPTLSPDARRLLLEYHWPGNLTELRGVAERLALLYAGGEVTALRLPPEIQAGPTTERPTLGRQIARLEREAIAEALREAGGKKIRAAALLGISRPTLDKKLVEFNLQVERRRP